jgi:hypothetical protein
MKVPRLFSHRAEPYVEINLSDAQRLGITAASLVEIVSGEHRSIARALISDAVKPGEMFLPMHWSEAFAFGSRANMCTPSAFDPVSGQPALKSANVTLRRFAAAWHALVSRKRTSTSAQNIAQHAPSPMALPLNVLVHPYRRIGVSFSMKHSLTAAKPQACSQMTLLRFAVLSYWMENLHSHSLYRVILLKSVAIGLKALSVRMPIHSKSLRGVRASARPITAPSCAPA